MNHTSFRAIVVNETESKQFVRNVVDREVSSLPEGDVFIQVHYSSLNYKDALSATGNKVLREHILIRQELMRRSGCE